MPNSFNASFDAAKINNRLSYINRNFFPYLDEKGKLKFEGINNPTSVNKSKNFLSYYRYLIVPLHKLGMIKYKKNKFKEGVSLVFVPRSSVSIKLLQQKLVFLKDGVLVSGQVIPIEVNIGHSINTLNFMLDYLCNRKVEPIVEKAIYILGSSVRIESLYDADEYESDEELVEAS